MTTGRVSLDVSPWPVAVLNLGGILSDEDYEHALSLVAPLVEHREPFCLVVDATEVRSVPTAAQRKRLGDRMIRGAADAVSVGTVVVVRSSLLRMTMTALTWASPSVYERRIVTTRQEAMWEAEAMLRRAGVSFKDDVSPSSADA